MVKAMINSHKDRFCRGFSLVDLLLALTLMLTLVLPLGRIVNSSKALLLRSQHLNESSAILEKAVHRVHSDGVSESMVYEEEGFEVSIELYPTKYDEVAGFHIQVKEAGEMISETRVFKHIR